MTQEDQAYSGNQQSYLPARQNLINQPFQNQWREKRERAAESDAEETGNMPAKEGPDLPEQPSHFGRDPRDHAGPRSLQERKTAPAEESVGYVYDQARFHASVALFENLTIENDLREI
jgi:hypothetical protein